MLSGGEELLVMIYVFIYDFSEKKVLTEPLSWVLESLYFEFDKELCFWSFHR